MANTTMAFDESVNGWTSEFSFVPDSGISLNNNYYTFKDGQMWVHNDSTLSRNNFYGVQNNTIIEFVFNEDPTVVKNFKTLSYEGVGEWPAEIETNLEDGQITQYVLKEGERYSWIQGDAANQFQDVDYASNAVSGIGEVTNIVSPEPPEDPDEEVGDSSYVVPRLPDFITPGDAIYLVESGDATSTPTFAGVVGSIDKPNNSILITQTGVPFGSPTPQAPVVGDFLLYVKDNRQEKSGIIGYYSVVTMTNEDTGRAEIFSVNSSSFIQTKS